MALIRCPECGHKVSTEADKCPECGYPTSKMSKEEVFVEKKEEEKKSGIETLVLRSSAPGYLSVVAAIGMAVGCICLAGSILGICMTDSELLALFLFVLALAVLLVVISTKVYSNIGRNSRNKKSLIDFDHDKNIIIVHTLSGKDVEVDPKDYIGIQRNYWTDFVVNFKFQADGRKLSLSLGFTEDVGYAREFLFNKRSS